MPNTVCWHCDARTQHELQLAAIATSEDDPKLRAPYLLAFYGAYQCTSCKAFAVGITVATRRDAYGTPADNLNRATKMIWQPSPGMTRTYEDVPPHIADAATEAYECHAQQHFRASILLARSVIEATAKEKGIVKGTLQAKITALFDQKWIRQHIKDGADSIRYFGNDMAHGDFVQPVTEEESALVITLMEEILDEVFQSRAKVTRAQAAVAARKQQAQVGP